MHIRVPELRELYTYFIIAAACSIFLFPDKIDRKSQGEKSLQISLESSDIILPFTKL